jgi:hypothetical protein
LVIENHPSYTVAGTTALIYGEFDNRVLVFNGKTNIRPHVATNIGLVVRGFTAQSANLQEWHDVSNNILSTVSENGYFTTRKTSAPADAELTTGELAIWFDASAGAAKVKFKGKNASGTVVAGEVALS